VNAEIERTPSLHPIHEILFGAGLNEDGFCDPMKFQTLQDYARDKFVQKVIVVTTMKGSFSEALPVPRLKYSFLNGRLE
jgi:hypothetical protein